MASLPNLSALVAFIALGLFLAIQCFQIPSPSLLKTVQRREGDRSHWCCKGDRTPVVTKVSRKESQRYMVKKNYTYVSDYKPCHRFDVNTTIFFCPVHKTEIVKTPMYKLVTVWMNKTETPTCKERDLVCCKGFSLFMSNCYKPDELKTIKDLMNSGLVG